MFCHSRYQENYSLIGTHRRLRVDQYDHPAIGAEETDYLLALVNGYLERPLARRRHRVRTYSGVRPL